MTDYPTVWTNPGPDPATVICQHPLRDREPVYRNGVRHGIRCRTCDTYWPATGGGGGRGTVEVTGL